MEKVTHSMSPNSSKPTLDLQQFQTRLSEPLIYFSLDTLHSLDF